MNLNYSRNSFPVGSLSFDCRSFPHFAELSVSSAGSQLSFAGSIPHPGRSSRIFRWIVDCGEGNAMALSDAKQCKGISKRSGERCRQPAIKGLDVCRFHHADAGFDNDTGTDKSPRTGGAPADNTNALKHGAYSLKLLPEEEPIYRLKRDNFIEQLGKVDIFDEQVVHMLALISAKLDVSATKGAPAQALIPISNEILKLLRSLKETRDSRDQEEEETSVTMADLLAEMSALDNERGVSMRDEQSRKRMIELEKEVNDLRKRLDLQPREDIDHKLDRCNHCRKDSEYRKNADSDWVCQSCGHVVLKAEDKAKQPVDKITSAMAEGR